jgi:hypothetical protein
MNIIVFVECIDSIILRKVATTVPAETTVPPASASAVPLTVPLTVPPTDKQTRFPNITTKILKARKHKKIYSRSIQFLKRDNKNGETEIVTINKKLV